MVGCLEGQGETPKGDHREAELGTTPVGRAGPREGSFARRPTRGRRPAQAPTSRHRRLWKLLVRCERFHAVRIATKPTIWDQRLSFAHSLLNNGSLLASPLRLIFGDPAEFFRPRLTSLCLPSQSLGLRAFGMTLVRGLLCTLLGLLRARQGPFSLDAKPLSFTARSLLLLFASLHRRSYDEREQHQETRHDDYPKPARHGVRRPERDRGGRRGISKSV